MNWCRRLLFLALVSTCVTAKAQDDTSFLSDVETELTSADSLSIFNLIDSLLQEGGPVGSQLVTRLSYNSNVLSTGRTLGINNFGLSPGVSYYHKSGLFADLSGYWSKDFAPSYYLTVTSLGYLHIFSKHFSIISGYDRYFYVAGDDNYIPYKNTVSATPIFDLKPVSISLNYSYYFGDATAHRIMPGISFNFGKKIWKVNRIAITPSFYALFGDETVIDFEFIRVGRQFIGIKKDRHVFGVMNYAISIPVSLAIKKWIFMFTYAYNIPKALPGETLTFSESTYLSACLIRLFNLTPGNPKFNPQRKFAP